jgi:hypothetical protein
MTVRRLSAVLAAGLLAAACTSGRPAAAGSTTTTTLPTVLTSVTPPGWVPVDFGDLQISVPSDWDVLYYYEAACSTAVTAGAVYVGEPPAGAGCGGLPSGNAVLLRPLVPGQPLLNALTVINGIETWSAVSTNPSGWRDYAVPSFGVLLSVHGPGGDAVAKTLTRAPATVALATGAPPPVPKTWKWVTGGDVRFAVPASWPTTTGNVEGPLCALGVALSSPDEVQLDSDQYVGPFASCPAALRPELTPVVPADGVVVDLHPVPGWPPSTQLGSCLQLHGLKACLYARTPTVASDRMAELDILFVEVTVPGQAGHELLEIGLAGNGMVARTILYSLRTA